MSSSKLVATAACMDWLTDPTVFAVNREPAHSDHRFYDHAPLPGETMGLRQSLDGRWRVAVTEAPRHAFPSFPTATAAAAGNAAPATAQTNATSPTSPTTANATPDFALPDYDDTAFSGVEVPSMLEMAGLLTPKYVNQQYPWDGHADPKAPDIPDHGHVAVYRRNFAPSATIQAALRVGRRVTVTFHGAATAIYVWLNGAFIGYAEDSFTPSEFDVTAALREDGNILTVACYEFASASWLEDQDFWRLHGLFRSVEITAQPAAHIEDLHVTADYDHVSGGGTLDVRAIVRDADRAGRAKVSLADADGSVLWCDDYDVASIVDTLDGSRFTDSTIGTAAIRFGTALAAVLPWSAEDPRLYTLTITLTGDSGEIIEVVPQRFGFRRFAIVDGIMTLNGKRIVFRGADRHEFDARRGRAITEADMIADLTICKRNNINAIRASHYPNQSRWYELCDEYGIYLIDETNLETHGTWSSPGDVVMSDTAVPGSDERWLGACVDRVANMIGRDRNHPSVLIWSLGNESYAGDVFRAMYRFAHAADPTRPVHYEGMTWNRDYEDVTDIETRMYAKPDEIERYLTDDPRKPYLSCEYMHAMGNSVGGLHEYVALERYPHYQGGFIWDFINQAIWQRIGDGTERLAYGGDFGGRPCDYEFSGNGLVFADRTPTPKLQEVKRLYANVTITPNGHGVAIANGNLFRSTEGDLFTARMLVNGEPHWQADCRFAVAAGETREFPIMFPDAAALAAGARGLGADGTIVEVTYEVSQRLAESTPWAPAGYEITFGQFTERVDGVAAAPDPAARADSGESDAGAASPSGSGSVTMGRWNIGVRTPDSEILLSRAHGGIISFVRDGREMVIRRPSITCFRPLTDNDRGNASGFDRAQWFGAGRYASVTGTRIERTDAGVTAEYTYALAEPNRTAVTVRYAVDASSGRIRLTVNYPGGAQAPTLPAFGLEWMLPEQYANLRFYGLGPEETYRDRLHGARLGVFERTASEDCAAYLVPQETGNHEGVRWAEVTDGDGHGMRVSQAGDEPFAASLLPYSSLMLEEATHADELPAVRHTFLRLLAAQMGVGGDDSWGAPVHEAYQLPADRPYTLDVTLELI